MRRFFKKVYPALPPGPLVCKWCHATVMINPILQSGYAVQTERFLKPDGSPAQLHWMLGIVCPHCEVSNDDLIERHKTYWSKWDLLRYTFTEQIAVIKTLLSRKTEDKQ